MGLDLSLSATGLAHSRGAVTITSRYKGEERLDDLERKILHWITADHGDLVVIEDYAYRAHDAHAHALGELGGVIKLALWRRRTPYVLVKPNLRAKYATGKGNGSKDSVLVAAVKRLGYEGSSKDEADSLWLQAMGDAAYGQPRVQMPEEHRKALRTVRWPIVAEVAPCVA